MSPDPAAGKAKTAAEAQNCWVFISKGAGHFLVCKITRVVVAPERFLEQLEQL
jgi:hypothetical protein